MSIRATLWPHGQLHTGTSTHISWGSTTRHAASHNVPSWTNANMDNFKVRSDLCLILWDCCTACNTYNSIWISQISRLLVYDVLNTSVQPLSSLRAQVKVGLPPLHPEHVQAEWSITQVCPTRRDLLLSPSPLFAPPWSTKLTLCRTASLFLSNLSLDSKGCDFPRVTACTTTCGCSPVCRLGAWAMALGKTLQLEV